MRLALPALGALAAEPLYVLGDTAIVGHVGTQAARRPRARRAPARPRSLGFVHRSSSTARRPRSSRLYGAGQRREALDVGVQATWFALVLGLARARASSSSLAGPALRLLAGGARRRVARAGADLAPHRRARRAVHARDRRRARAGCAAFQDTRTAVRRARRLQPRERRALAHADPRLRPRHRGLGDRQRRLAGRRRGASSSILLVRRGAPLAPSLAAHARAAARRARPRRCARSRSSPPSCSRRRVAARMGDAQVAAHQIGFQLWIFVALALDSVAIAAQALIGRLLGAGAVDARGDARRGGCSSPALVFGVARRRALRGRLARRPALFTLRRRTCATRPACCGRGSSG